MNQRAIDEANRAFWDELCGSGLAQQLGIREHTPESLRRFDEAYLGYYPYLLKRVDLSRIAGRRVLEVGLGYGTLGEKLAEVAHEYVGLDIAEGPVRMMNCRLAMRGLQGRAIHGSILECPVDSASMDCVVSIGCFHHTGNLARCLEETYRVLRPGGWAFLMVYNRFSLRQWLHWPGKTLQAAFHEVGLAGRPCVTPAQRKAYDSSVDKGCSAPETEFFAISELKLKLKPFPQVSFFKENAEDLLFCGRILCHRARLLSTVGRLMGLDIYIRAQRPLAVSSEPEAARR